MTSQMTPLHLAAMNGYFDGCLVLVAFGADPSIKDIPFDWAKLYERSEMCAFLKSVTPELRLLLKEQNVKSQTQYQELLQQLKQQQQSPRRSQDQTVVNQLEQHEPSVYQMQQQLSEAQRTIQQLTQKLEDLQKQFAEEKQISEQRKQQLSRFENHSAEIKSFQQQVAIPLPHSRELSPEVPLKYDVFISHDWGQDEQQRDNHARASKLNKALKVAGLVTWFDEERLTGNIMKQIADGIDASRLVMILVTRRYMEKASGTNPHDFCYLEFNYAAKRKSAQRMIPIVMERRMTDTQEWMGLLGFVLGNEMHFRFTDDNDMERLVGQVVSRVSDQRTL
eukprot:c7188_g1_i1.p1 GENE.c7188_g1_i1~~c7188_g1_i1.p1  ORF type:complete len:336 (+),score=90.22 c7188_g1_i1:175-1182(+)